MFIKIKCLSVILNSVFITKHLQFKNITLANITHFNKTEVFCWAHNS